jgi:hypothetical protein
VHRFSAQGIACPSSQAELRSFVLAIRHGIHISTSFRIASCVRENFCVIVLKTKMPDNLPLMLLFAWVIFFGCAVGNYHHEHGIQNWELRSTKLDRILGISQLLWLVTAIAILGYYFIVTHWYFAVGLAIFGSFLGAVAAGVLIEALGASFVSARALFAWPVAAAYAFVVIHRLPP